MILTLIVILFIALQTIHGYRLGFSHRIMTLIWMLVSFVLAIFLNQTLGIWLANNFNPSTGTQSLGDNLGYRFLSFLIIIFAGRILMFLFRALMPRHTLKKGILKTIDKILGAFVSFVISYIMVYFLLSMVNALQIDWFIQQTIDSPVLQYIIYETPLLSQQIFNSIFGIKGTTINL